MAILQKYWVSLIGNNNQGILALAFLLLALLIQPAQANATFETPMLTLDPGMHTDTIKKMATDHDEKVVATLSSDKTLKVWTLPSLKLWKTIRVPTEAGSEGRLDALAISPSGSVIAAGGDTCKTWVNSYCIYLFNTASGKMLMRITGLPEQVNHLAFSPDSQYLAAVLDNGAGLRVFRLRDGHAVAKDTSYGSNSYWVDFSSTGKIVTTSSDGTIRLYNNNLQFEMLRQVSKNLKPHVAIFSPDGSKIAVSFLGKIVISVFSSKNLDVIYLPDVSGISDDIETLAWSTDGRSLYGAGKYKVHLKSMVRWWSKAGQPDTAGISDYVDIPLTDTDIQHILPRKNGGLLFTSVSVALGEMDSQGFLGTVRKYPNVVFPKCRGFLRISPSGSLVSFPMTPENILNSVFSVDHLQFSTDKSTVTKLMVPKRRSSSFDLRATLADDSFSLSFDGRPLTMHSFEEISCYAVALDERFFIVSTNQALRMYDQSGTLRWRIPVDSPIRALNITENGKFSLVALNNGIVNWYRVATGRLVLSLFVYAETGEWIAWTPDSYYVSSQKAENFLGWHKNIAVDQAAVFTPVSSMKAKFNKLDVIRKILE